MPWVIAAVAVLALPASESSSRPGGYELIRAAGRPDRAVPQAGPADRIVLLATLGLILVL